MTECVPKVVFEAFLSFTIILKTKNLLLDRKSSDTTVIYEDFALKLVPTKYT